jgi:hypothetical protein
MISKTVLRAGLIFVLAGATAHAGLTDGWIPDRAAPEVQSPYNLPHSDRYTFDAKTDTYHLWVFRADKPMGKKDTTEPRTELSFEHYTSGRRQFEADFLVVTNTSRVTIMQVFGATGRATSLQLRVYDGDLKRYENETLLKNIYNKWFHLNVIHDTGTHEIEIFVNGQPALTTKDNGGTEWHFKCGVYAQPRPSPEMEVYCRNIRIYHQ